MNFSFFHTVQCKLWKDENFILTWKIFRETEGLNLLISRNFLIKSQMFAARHLTFLSRDLCQNNLLTKQSPIQWKILHIFGSLSSFNHNLETKLRSENQYWVDGFESKQRFSLQGYQMVILILTWKQISAFLKMFWFLLKSLKKLICYDNRAPRTLQSQSSRNKMKQNFRVIFKKNSWNWKTFDRYYLTTSGKR